MQQAEEPIARAPNDDHRERGFPPLKVFLALSIALATIFILLSGGGPREPSGQEGGRNATVTSAVSETKAKDAFEQLHNLLTRAHRLGDSTLVSLYAVPGSPTAIRDLKGIRQLRRDGVIDKSLFERKNLDVLSITTSTIKLREVVVARPRYVIASTGREITSNPNQAEEQVVIWTIKLHEGSWRISDGLVVRARPVS